MDIHDELFDEITLRLKGVKIQQPAALRGLASGICSDGDGGKRPIRTTPSAGCPKPLFAYANPDAKGAQASVYWAWFCRGFGQRLGAAAKAKGLSVDQLLKDPTAVGVCQLSAELFGVYLSENEVNHLHHAPVSAEWLRPILQEAKAMTSSIISYRGFTEHAYRLVFDYEDKYGTTPHLQTILPDGTIESEKDLTPQKEKGIIAYAFPQSTTEDVAQKHPKSPFVWKRNDKSHAVVQTWSTNYNDKFKADFTCTIKNPNPKLFTPQAAEEFKTAVVELFGQKAKSHDILYCHKVTKNPKTVYVGTAGELQCFLRENPQVVKEMDIIQPTENGFVCRTVNLKKEEGKKDFKFGEQNTMYALYTKQGWDEMACITPWSQFQKDREMGEKL